MFEVIGNFVLGEYTILLFDAIPRDFTKIKVNNVTYDVTIPYDIENAVAVKSTADFNNCMVEFVS